MGRLVTVPGAGAVPVDLGGTIQTIDVFNSSNVTGAYVKLAYDDDPNTTYTLNPLSGKGLEPWDTADDVMSGKHCFRSITLTGQGVAAVVVEIDYTLRQKEPRGVQNQKAVPVKL